MTDDADHRHLTIQLQFGHTYFDVRTEYFVYEANSFIADVGGFLGLLLGYSILGLLESVVNTAELVLGRKKGRE